MLGLPPGLNPQVTNLIEQLKDNMLIALVKKAGGTLVFTVTEVDDAVEHVFLESDPDKQTFTMTLQPREKGR